MMPLCTTATRPARWGWAFFSTGGPWVAHRVWPMPTVPVSGWSASTASTPLIFPGARRRSSAPEAVMAATPALS